MNKQAKMVGKNDESYSKEVLDSFYKNGLIPAEKKPFLTDLKNSEGAFLGVQTGDKETKFIMDAASQIATIGLGFNHQSLFGCAHYIESWTNQQDSQKLSFLKTRFRHLINRKLNRKSCQVTFCHSGAEANESALIDAWKNRSRKDANKVLAFEGSFHGRMLITLSSTWNPSKREPFEWDEFKTVYCPFPEIEGDQYEISPTQEWLNFWSNEITKKNYVINKEWEQDPEVKKELDSLFKVKEALERGDIFAIIVEPMQCEGGDRYATSRYFNALALLAKTYRVSLVFDEVQTGFHLGRDFFWHHTFDLRDSFGKRIYPDYVTCAKKAQVGLIISKNKVRTPEEFSVASAIRGYHHAMALDQSHEDILNLEDMVREKLNSLIKNFPDKFSRPRVKGLSFAFELSSDQDVLSFVAKRFEHGLLFYQAGSHTLRFRLNLSFTPKIIDELFKRITHLAWDVYDNKLVQSEDFDIRDKKVEDLYDWQNYLLSLKEESLKNKYPSKADILNRLDELFHLPEGVELKTITEDNFNEFTDEITSLQKRVYEPQRQTEIDVFKKAICSPGGIGLALLKDEGLMGLAVCSQIRNFPLEKILRRDKTFTDEKTYYVVDITIDSKLGGLSLGRYLKYAITALSYSSGAKRINGRNRHRMAKEMLKINLSLGAREVFYVPEDYLDEHKYRDCVYYTTHNIWNLPKINLGDAINAPLGIQEIDQTFIEDNLSCIVNKVCLSNFVSKSFLDSLEYIMKQGPSELQHGYSASGQSECVDKIVKSIWYNNREKRPYKKLLTFKDHFFGKGSFLSHSLSSPESPFFETTHLECPKKDNYKDVLQSVKEELNNNPPLAVWLEPLPQNTMLATPREFIVELKKLCAQNNVPLVFNETGSSMFRYTNDHFYLSCDPECSPDLFMTYLGGQGAVVFTKKEFFIDKPLMMISTWDGDEYSFNSYKRAAESILSNKEGYFETKRKFEQKLLKELEGIQNVKFSLQNGVGQIEGQIPHSLAIKLKDLNHKYLVCPTLSGMKRYLND